MAVSLAKGQDEPCPQCQSQDISLAAEREHPVRVAMTFKAYRRCNACGYVFEPKSRKREALALTLFGLSGACASLFAVFEGVSASSAGWLVLGCLTGLLGTYGGVLLTIAGIRALRARARVSGKP